MKAALALLLFLLGGFAAANDALILISPERAGPIVDESNYVQGDWILWPAKDQSDGQNRILSLLTGIDWESSSKDLVFAQRDGLYLSTAISELQRRGYFAARDRVVLEPTYALQWPGGMISPISLFLALDGRTPQVTPLDLQYPGIPPKSGEDAHRAQLLRGLAEPNSEAAKDPKNPMYVHWPPGLVIAEADNWDRVAEITQRATGRVLVVEYPPMDDRRWSRFWLRGQGWGSRLPVWKEWNVPGLIPASQIGDLVVHPLRFQWVENDSENWVAPIDGLRSTPTRLLS